MRRALAVVALLTAACSPPWPSFTGAAPKGVDSRLGQQVMEGHPLRRPRVQLQTSGDRVFVSVMQPTGVNRDVRTVSPASFDLYEVDFATGRSTVLPAWPLSAAVETRFRLTLDPRHLLVNQERRLAFFDGTSWTVLPTAPVDFPQGAEVVAVDARHVVASRTVPAFHFFDGTSWRSLSTPGVLGPVAREGFVVLNAMATTGSQGEWPFSMCAKWFDWNGQQVRESCFDNLDSFDLQPAVNGTLDDFQALVGTSLVHFHEGKWTRGNELKATLRPALGSTRVHAQDFVSPAPNGVITLVEGAETIRQLAPQLSQVFTSTCGDDEVTCPSDQRRLSDGFASLADGSVVMVGTISVDARLYVMARRLAGTEISTSLQPVCTKDCSANQRCELYATGHMNSTTEKRCVPLEPSLRVGLPRAEVSASFAHPEDAGTNWQVEVMEPDGGPLSDVQVLAPPPSLRLSLPELTPFALRVRVDAHQPIELQLVSPYVTRKADLGRLALVRAEPLGVTYLPPNPPEGIPNTKLAGHSLVFSVFAVDGGVSWQGVRSATDGGLETVDLGPGRRTTTSNSPVSAHVAPQAGRLFIAAPNALKAFSLDLEPRGELAGSDWTLLPASDATRYVVLGREGQQATRVEVGPQTVSVHDTFTRPASQVWSSSSGDVVVRDDGPSAYHLDGRRVPFAGALSQPSVPPLLDGAGARFYFTRLTPPRGSETLAIDTDSGVVSWSTDAGVLLNVGATSRQIVRSQQVPNPDGGFPVTEHQRFDAETPGVVLGTGGQVNPGTLPKGAWALWNLETGEHRLFRIDDGVEVGQFTRYEFTHREDGSLLGVEDCDETMRGCDLRQFSADLAMSTVIPGGALGGLFGDGSVGLLRSGQLYAVSSARLPAPFRRVVPDESDLKLDDRLAPGSGVVGSAHVDALGAPCAVFSVVRQRYAVDPWARVTPSYAGHHLFCTTGR